MTASLHVVPNRGHEYGMSHQAPQVPCPECKTIGYNAPLIEGCIGVRVQGIPEAPVVFTCRCPRCNNVYDVWIGVDQ